MSNITEITSGLIAPNQTLEDTDLQTTWIANPEGLRDRTYGAGALAPLGALAHDHGQNRGLQLDRALLSLSFGPHNQEGEAAADALPGIPLYEPSSGSFVDTPKLLASSYLFIPGGVTSVFAVGVVDLPGSGSRSVTLTVEIRPLRLAGQVEPGAGVAVTETLTFSTSATATPCYLRAEGEIEASQLQSLGDNSLDREGEICLYVTTNPPGSAENRLLSLTVYPGDAPTALGPNEPLTYQSVTTVTPLDVHEGQPLTAPLFDKARARLNQDTLGVLGAVPGLTANPAVPDTTSPWVVRLRHPHQHQGRRHTDAQGDTVPDGQCVRYGLWSHCYVNDLGDTRSSQTMDTTAYLGQPTRPAGTVTFEGRLSIPDGLGGLLLRFALYPQVTVGTELTRLYLSAHLSSTLSGAAGGTNLISSIQAGPYLDDSGPRPSSTDFKICLVDPIDTVSYQPNASRAGLGLWTTMALAPESQIPDSASTDNAYRVSQEVFLGVSVTETGDYRLRLRFELETGAAGSGSYATGSRLQWVGLTPAYGY